METKIRALSVGDFLGSQTPTKDFEDYVKGQRFDIKNVPAEDSAIFFNQGLQIGSRGNIITITGMAKSRKTVIASALATSIFRPEGLLGFTCDLSPNANVLHVDTEQAYQHYYYSVKRIFDDAGITDIPERFTSIHTRDADIPFRIDLIDYLLEKLRPEVFILDGITDLIYDINSQEETVKLGERLLKWTVKFNMLLVVVLHTTKTTGYMTGAIGTYLEKKCETAIKVIKPENDDSQSVVSCQYSRGKSFQEFMIRYDDDRDQYVISDDIIAKPGQSANAPEGFHIDILYNLFKHSFMQVERLAEATLRTNLKRKVRHELTLELSGRDIKSWLKYAREKEILHSDSEGFLMLATPFLGGSNTAKSTAIQGSETAVPADSDELPF